MTEGKKTAEARKVNASDSPTGCISPMRQKIQVPANIKSGEMTNRITVQPLPNKGKSVRKRMGSKESQWIVDRYAP